MMSGIDCSSNMPMARLHYATLALSTYSLRSPPLLIQGRACKTVEVSPGWCPLPQEEFILDEQSACSQLRYRTRSRGPMQCHCLQLCAHIGARHHGRNRLRHLGRRRVALQRQGPCIGSAAAAALSSKCQMALLSTSMRLLRKRL